MAEQVNSALVRALTVMSTGPSSICAAAEKNYKMTSTVMLDFFVPGHSTPACWLVVQRADVL